MAAPVIEYIGFAFVLAAIIFNVGCTIGAVIRWIKEDWDG